MSIFTRIKDAIFGHDTKAATSSQAPTKPASSPGIPASPADAKWTPAAASAPVDVERVLADLASRNSQKLNWQTSIVDLMKLLGIDSSLENRKELARELGYAGNTADSAAMNIWLHKRVMQELEKNGGKVPASLVA
jgi:Domain of unknown function (DUF3597)